MGKFRQAAIRANSEEGAEQVAAEIPQAVPWPQSRRVPQGTLFHDVIPLPEEFTESAPETSDVLIPQEPRAPGRGLRRFPKGGSTQGR